MKTAHIQAPVFMSSMPDFQEVKPKLLAAIASMGIHGLPENETYDQKIYNTDYYLPRETDRPYWPLLTEFITEHNNKIIKDNEYANWAVDVFWFQHYNTGDYHGWHVHGGSAFTNVFYVNLPDKTTRTMFKFGDKEFNFEVSEGDLITFPSYLLHCSKPNTNLLPKVVVSFNTQINIAGDFV